MSDSNDPEKSVLGYTTVRYVIGEDNLESEGGEIQGKIQGASALLLPEEQGEGRKIY